MITNRSLQLHVIDDNLVTIFICFITLAAVVQEWEPCTRQCDYGARSRTTVCSDNMENTEVELCKVTDCPGTIYAFVRYVDKINYIN